MRAMASSFSENAKDIQIDFVVRTKSSAPVGEVCKELGIDCICLPYRDPDEFETALLHLIQERRIDLIVLAGFLKLLSADFCDNCHKPIFNIHPALLPAYGGKGMYGAAVHKAVFAAKEQYSGATVHLVDPIYDHGRILAQEKVWIGDCKSSEEIAARVLKIEHSIYAKAIYNYLSK